MKNKWLILSAVLLLFSGITQANPDWQLLSADAGITLEKRELPGKPYHQFRAQMIVPVPMDPLLAIFEDPSYCTQWLHDCRQSKTVQQINPRERIDYTVIDAPFPLNDRDMYIRSSVSYDSQNEIITINLRGVESHAEQPGRVRVLDLQGHWRFRQLNDQQLRVDYLIYNNPQVTPASLVNASMPGNIFNTFKKLRALASSEQFRHIKAPPERLQAIKVR